MTTTSDSSSPKSDANAVDVEQALLGGSTCRGTIMLVGTGISFDVLGALLVLLLLPVMIGLVGLG